MISFMRGIFSFKDSLSPSYINLKNPKYIEIDGLFYSGFIIVNYSRENNELIFKNIIDNNEDVVISMFYERQDTIKVIKDLYGISSKISVRNGYNYTKNYIYVLEVTKQIQEIIKDLSLDTNIPRSYIIDDDLSKRAYLRGLFISCGSINDPKKSRYHLEFFVNNEEYANYILTSNLKRFNPDKW